MKKYGLLLLAVSFIASAPFSLQSGAKSEIAKKQAEEKQRIADMNKARKARLNVLTDYYQTIPGQMDTLTGIASSEPKNAKAAVRTKTEISKFYKQLGNSIKALDNDIKTNSMSGSVQEIQAAGRKDQREINANENLLRDFLKNRKAGSKVGSKFSNLRAKIGKR